MFKIAVVGWNVEKYIDKCLGSLVNQKFKDWEVQVIIDPSSDKSFETAIKWQRDKIKIHQNNTRVYALGNIISAINMLNPSDEDIIVTVDGDDWLIDSNSLEIVQGYYNRFPDTWVTHGSWVPYPNPSANTNNAPYSEYEFNNNIRKFSWRASHLRTFKYKIWKLIKDNDFRDEQGCYYKSAWDLAIMWPILEMSTYKRVKFIQEKLYMYNQETPYSDGIIRLKEQMYLTDYIARMKPYEPL
jgi:glycosyltransferase involved in cell wall biosynthesis